MRPFMNAGFREKEKISGEGIPKFLPCSYGPVAGGKNGIEKKVKIN